MSTDYFKDFSKVAYKFGNEQLPVTFQNISLYVEVLDLVKNAESAYQYYHILDNERPDQLSFKLYDTPEYYWTFLLMNDHIREQGWPLSNNKILEKAIKDHPHKVITTRSVLTDKLKKGQTIIGNTTGATARIEHRDLNLGQLFLDDVVGQFAAGEIINSSDGASSFEQATIHAYEDEYLSAHHYEDADGNYIDIDPTVGSGIYAEVSHLDHYIRINDSLKIIKVIKPDSVLEIAKAFSDALRS